MSDPIEIRPLAPDDAARLTACFERCYGDTYPARFFYDPAAIRARVADGRLHPVVAATPEGEIVGHMALTRRHSRALTLEAGNTIVDPRYRNRGLAARLGAALFEACRLGGYAGFHHYPTTAHPIMQKLAIQGGGVETGVMLAYIPAETDYKDLTGTSEQGRLAVVTVYQPIGAAPERELFLPPRFAGLLRTIYRRAGLTRRAATPAGAPLGPTRLHASRDHQRGLLRLEVEAVGADLEDRIAAAAGDAGTELTHVDLSLADPAAPHAVGVLRRSGYFFCAILPEFAVSDVLRLQRLRDPAEPRRLPELVHPEAREILRMALADRAAAR